MLNIISHQTHNEIPLHTHEDGCNEKEIITSVVEDVEKSESSYTTGQNADWCVPFGKQCCISPTG